jgi:hypothetical protein
MSDISTFRRRQAVATRHWLVIIVASLSVAGCGWGGPLVPTAGGAGECPNGLCGAPQLNGGGSGSLVSPGDCPNGEFCGGPPTVKP